jgi:hypothetical protein
MLAFIVVVAATVFAAVLAGETVTRRYGAAQVRR